MKPGLSLARIGVRPMRRPTSVVASSARSEESAVATTSTSFISAGGLKKCIPTTRSGPRRLGGDRGHRQRGGVGGEDRLRRRRPRPGRRTGPASARGPRAPPRSPGRSRRGSATSPTASSRPPAASASSALHISRFTPLPSDSTPARRPPPAPPGRGPGSPSRSRRGRRAGRSPSPSSRRRRRRSARPSRTSLPGGRVLALPEGHLVALEEDLVDPLAPVRPAAGPWRSACPTRVGPRPRARSSR